MDFIGTTGNDSLPASAGLNGGDDTFLTNGGRDTVSGGEGNDTLTINAAVVGGSNLSGGAGTDTLLITNFVAQTVGYSIVNPAGILNSAVQIVGPGSVFSSFERVVFDSDVDTSVNLILGIGGSIGTTIFPNYLTTGGIGELVGGAGFDALALAAVYSSAPGAPASYTITAPTFTYTNWTTPDRAYLPGDRIVVTVSGNAGGVINGTAHAGVQGITGGSANDTINGSNDMDLLAGAGGLNQIFGNGGNDTLVLINNQTILNQSGTIVYQPETTFNGFGSTFDGGDGFDFLLFGGNVFFGGTVANIEGIYLSPAITPPLPATVPGTTTSTVIQRDAFVVMDSAVFAQLPTDLLVAGVGTIEIDVASGASLDLSGIQFDEGANVKFEIYAGDGNGTSIVGSSGEDYIAFGNGNQTATGGAGEDRFSFSGGGNTVTDFTDGEDKIDLSDSDITSKARLDQFLSLVGGGISQVGDDVVLQAFTPEEGSITITLQNFQLGNLDATDFIFAPAPTGPLFLSGGPSTDILFGGAFNDTIQGNDGDDIIFTGGGHDSVDGGAGNDAIIFDTPLPATGQPGTYNGGAGFDTLVLRPNGSATLTPQGTMTTSYLVGSPTGLQNIEAIRFDSQAGENVSLQFVNRIGNVGANFPTPGTLIGGDGIDTFVQIAVNGMGANSEYVIPTFTTVNWQPAEKGYLPGDNIVLIGVDGQSPAGVVTYNYVLRANAANGAAGLVQTLFGAGGNDSLYGSDGKDLLIGGGGVNLLQGNGGDDTLIIGNNAPTTRPGQPPAATTTLTGAGSTFDGGSGTDFLSVGGVVNFAGSLISIEGFYLQTGYTLNNANFGTQAAAVLTIGAAKLSALINTLEFAGTGSVVVNLAAGDRFIGNLYQFADGADVQFTVNGSSAADRIVGTSRASVLNGGDGNDQIIGGEGNDTLNGGSGNDTLTGGFGDDTYFVDSATDVVAESPGKGNDTIITTLAAYSLGNTSSVENLTGNGALNGNGKDNVLTGGTGDDTLDGLGGADTLNGGAGNDAYIVDSLGDVIVDSSGVDTVRARISYTLAAGLERLELLVSSTGTGNEGDNTITGSAGADTLIGLGGNDSLVGGAGADSLDGGSGNDTMAGGLGSDTYIVGSIGDVVDETGGDGTDTVFTGIAAYTLTAGVERLTYTGEGDFAGTGNELANRITTGAGNDTLDGGAGADTLSGGDGNDTYRVDNTGDTIFDTSGTDTVITTLASYTLAGALENLTYAGSGSFTGVGSFVANVITGGGLGDSLDGGNGEDTLNGMGGADTLVGGALNDVLSGGSGDDILIGGAGKDVLTGGDGADSFRFLAATDSKGALFDVVTDFIHGTDKLDFGPIDTNPVLAGDQGFAFIGGGAFSGTGIAQIRTFTLNGNTVVSADLDGNRTVDMLVQLNGIVTLDANDFVL